MPPEYFGFWEFPTFNTDQHSSCSTAQGLLAPTVQKPWLQKYFSFMVPKP
jgi:hypothetical protein